MPGKSKNLVIRYTENYKLFRQSDGNRKIHESQHKLLKASMMKYGFLPYWPIVVRKHVSGNFDIEDGQHRYSFAMGLNLPIYYVEATEKFVIQDVNNAQTVWRPEDYAEMYADSGLSDYQEVLDFSSNYESLSVAASAGLLAGYSVYSKVKLPFTTGNFKCTQGAWAGRVADLYMRLGSLKSGLKKSMLLQACADCCLIVDGEHFDDERLLHNAEKCKDKVMVCTNKDATLQMLEEVYNYHKTTKNLYGLRLAARIAHKNEYNIEEEVVDEEETED